MSTVQQAITLIHKGILPEVRFNSSIEYSESYFDENMMAQVVSVNEKHVDPEVVQLTFYVKPYEEHNAKVEKHTYYDKSGEPRLSSREVGMHPERHGWKESVWLMRSDECFEIIDPPLGKIKYARRP